MNPCLVFGSVLGINLGIILLYTFGGHTRLRRRCGRVKGSNLLENVEEEDVCAICLGIMKSNYVKDLPCGHKFHTACICSWIKHGPKGTKRTCPMCRQIL